MASPHRSLPTVIGPTENALRALLVDIIGPSPVETYERWVAINTIATTAERQTEAVASGLRRTLTESAALIEDLAEAGLVERRNKTWQLSPLGAATLPPLRAAVAEVTAKLTDGIDELDLATTVRVLDAVRISAIDEVARRSHAAAGDATSSPRTSSGPAASE